MLRLHLLPDDLLRLRISPLGPLGESQMALAVLQQRRRPALGDHWRLRSRACLSPDARSLARAFAVPGRQLDLYTVLGTVPDASEGIDRLLSDPAQLREELPHYPAALTGRLPSWVVDGVAGRPAEARRLGDALASAHAATVAPYWGHIQAASNSERSAATHVLASAGVHGLLDSLRPWARWAPPVLEIAYTSWKGVRETRLTGDGITLAPSFFCRRPEAYVPAQGGEVLLVYPAVRDPLALARLRDRPPDGSGGALAALLGRTRAAVLELTRDGTTTGDLARRLDVAPATASEHLGVLRSAGLITSRREGQRVWHTITPLGTSLAEGTAHGTE
ncbi:winged helix-turn-helix domain-containing protein [Streptomyces sp. L2]|uniref:ArsR/SmtB family transcription factor n=1 Tax=Streptomyces sp. L2 TaxID=2162665 RepID=UPI00101034F3|nr:winged helix-turn-helix domain-containing protein [Streptomyces sp. L2]